MAGRKPYWNSLSAHEVRRASRWALAGLVLGFAIGPHLPADWRWIALLVDFVGKMMVIWHLGRINVGAPGWRAGLPGEYDERETAERHQALATAYVIVVVLVMAVLVLRGTAKILGLPVPAPNWHAIAWTLLMACVPMALPAIILAWRRRRFDALDE